MTHSDEVSIGIIGAGITGLTAAAALQRKGIDCRLWEAEGRAGGAVRSREQEGYLVEEGPNSLLIKSRKVADWLDTLGLEDRRLEPAPEAAKRFVLRNGKPHPLPHSLRSAVSTPLYSRKAKLRVLKEPLIAPCPDADESVGSFVRRRLGPEFLDYGISCLVSGIYAGDPENLSIRHAFPKVWNLEQRHRSLIRGSLALKKERRRNGEPAFRPQMISYEHGLSDLTRELACKAGNKLKCSTVIDRIERLTDGRWQVSGRTSGRDFITTARHIILTIPQYRWPELNVTATANSGSISLSESLTQCPRLQYPPLSTLVLGFPRDSVAHALDGFGMLIPAVEKRFILGSIFSSSLFPGRAPEGHVALMNFIGGALNPERAELSEAELVDHTCRDLHELLGVHGHPSFVHHRFWPRAIPQYPVGHQVFLDQLENIESHFPGWHIQGNYRGGPGLSDCIENALNLVDKLQEKMRAKVTIG